MLAMWGPTGQQQQAAGQGKASALGRVESRTSVLELWGSDCSDSEASSPDRSSHGSPGGLPLLDAVMGSVCAAAMGGQALPPRTLHLLQQLFPSASAISATVPSADGLGMAVVTLMQPPAPPQPRRGRGGIPAVPHHHPTAQQQLAQPLAAGGVLSFGLSTQPPAAELQLMQAFADELSSRLDGGARKKAAPAPTPLLAGGPAPGALMPLDCFWMSC